MTYQKGDRVRARADHAVRGVGTITEIYASDVPPHTSYLVQYDDPPPAGFGSEGLFIADELKKVEDSPPRVFRLAIHGPGNQWIWESASEEVVERAKNAMYAGHPFSIDAPEDRTTVIFNPAQVVAIEIKLLEE